MTNSNTISQKTAALDKALARVSAALERAAGLTGAHDYAQCHEMLQGYQSLIQSIDAAQGEGAKKILLNQAHKVKHALLAQQMATYTMMDAILNGSHWDEMANRLMAAATSLEELN